jgi:hypothetical protein
MFTVKLSSSYNPPRISNANLRRELVIIAGKRDTQGCARTGWEEALAKHEPAQYPQPETGTDRIAGSRRVRCPHCLPPA